MAALVISYARVDQQQVRAVVALLRAGLKGLDRVVFWDADFEPGEPWFVQMSANIEAAAQLFVFWCAHSAASSQVEREVTYALSRSKIVVPVLIDDTPLNERLAPLHGIDLRGVIGHAAPVRETQEFFETARLARRSAIMATEPGEGRELRLDADVVLRLSLNKYQPFFAEWSAWIDGTTER
jgi:hypothetical protein